MSNLAESRRNYDLSAEGQLAQYMDERLYANFPARDGFSEIKRVHDKAEQLRGVDVQFIGMDGRTYLVDEKAQLYYLNRELPTFAFELLFRRGEENIMGWLCNPKLKTDFYMLIWPSATQDSPKGITKDHFTKTECLLVNKKKILKMLAKKGLTTSILLDTAKEIYEKGKIGKIPIVGLTGIYYYASDPQKYREAPVNLVVAKSLLIKLAERRYIVTPKFVFVDALVPA